VLVEDIEKADIFRSLRFWTRANGIRAIQTMSVLSWSGKFIGAFSTHYANSQTITGVQKEMNAHYADRFSRLFSDLLLP
jgi:hypothetical protein